MKLKRLTRNQNLIFRIILSITYLVFVFLYILLILEKGITQNDLVWLSISGVSFFLPFLAFFFPKIIHRILYKIAEIGLKPTIEEPPDKEYSYKTINYAYLWWLIIANVVILFGIILKLLS